jgi:hypothetical protein
MSTELSRARDMAAALEAENAELRRILDESVGRLREQRPDPQWVAVWVRQQLRSLDALNEQESDQ